MIIQTKVPDMGDPSNILQLFPRYNLQLLCCRYWWLKKWEFKELAYPFWRIYKNNVPGAFIISDGKEYELSPDKIIVIAPNTSYSTRIEGNELPDEGFALEGGRVDAENKDTSWIKNNCILHLFIHFNIGLPYDNVLPGVFEFDVTDHINEKLSVIINHLNVDFAQFSFYAGLAIQALISDLLSSIPESCWDLMSNDYRILNVLNYINSHLTTNLSNEYLAGQTKLAPNAFTRLFTQEVGQSPQRFIRKKRIDKACVLLHHSEHSIDEISEETGFANRYHFSRIFKQVTGISPAKYKKEFGMK